MTAEEQSISMKLKILNKNLLDEDDYTSSQPYDIDDGFNITSVKNETLDSGVVVISNLKSTVEMEPYDIVELLYDDDTLFKRMCIDTYTEQMLCINPKIYKYEIHLFSETKQLEGAVLPNLKITSLKNQAQRSVFHYIDQYMSEYCPRIRVASGSSYTWVRKWSIASRVITKFNSIDCPEMQWNTPTLREVLNDLMMIADCIPIIKDGKLDYMDLTDSPSTNNELEDVSDDKHINYITKSKSSEDYVSELQVKLENVTNTAQGVNNLVTHIEFVPFECPENQVTLTTRNVVAKTRYPIYNLKKMTILYPITVKDSNNNVFTKWVETELTRIQGNDSIFSLVFERQEWLTKPVTFMYVSNQDTFLYDIDKWKDYQNWSLYYTRGSNEISGFEKSDTFAWHTENFLPDLLEALYYAKYHYGPDDGYDVYRITKWYNVFFKIEYETLEGCMFRASKGENQSNTRVVIDNQTNSYVDSSLQGFLEYQKANRLGNEQLQINARYPINYTGHMIDIGDTYEDTVIYQVQKQYFREHIEVNALATKNYILRDYFTGVKSKIRSWAVVSGSEAYTRHDLIKYYCEFSYAPSVETVGLEEFEDNEHLNMIEYLTTPFNTAHYGTTALNVAYVRTWLKTNEGTAAEETTYYPEQFNVVTPSYYCLDLMSRVVGNSIVLTFEMLDNYWAGKSYHTTEDPIDGSIDDVYIRTSDIEVGTDMLSGQPYLGLASQSIVGSGANGGVPMYQHRYTDDNGEFTGGEIILGNGIVNGNYSATSLDNTNWAEWTANGWVLNSNTEPFVWSLYQRPRVYEWSIYDTTNTPKQYDYYVARIPFRFSKDSQEITNISTQFEFCSNTTDICFGKKWVTSQAMVYTQFESVTFYARFFNHKKYDFRRPDVIPSGIPEHSYTLTISKSYINKTTATLTFKLPASSATIGELGLLMNELKQSCCYIVDSNNNVYVAFNKNENFSIQTVGALKQIQFTLYLNMLKSRNKSIYSGDKYTKTDEL